MRMRIVLLAGVLAMIVAKTSWAENWPQFRGPAGDSVAGESRLPTEWSLDKNIQWKVKIPGAGWSCPVVWGDKLFVTTAITENQVKPKAGGMGGGRGRPGAGGPPGEKGKAPEGEKKAGDYQPPEKGKGKGGFGGFGKMPEPPNQVYRWEVYCLDRHTGKELWKNMAIERKPTIPTHSTNTYASETPIVDGERLYVYFGMTGLFCYDLGGKLLWKKDLGSYPMVMGWGTGSSPLLVGDQLYLQCDNETKSFIIALDKKTGEEVWKDARDERSTWSTPYLWKNKQRSELITSGTNKIRSYDPKTGKLFWELSAKSAARARSDEEPSGPGGGRGFGGGRGGTCSASPVGDEDMLYVGFGGGAGSNGPMFAVKAGASGDVSLKDGESSNTHVAWSSNRAGPPMASPLLYGGLLYVLDQRGGKCTCYEAKTGKQVYQERVPGAKGFTSSPWAYDGKVFLLDDDGQTFVIAAGREFKVVGKNPLNEMFWSSPAIAGGALYLRGIDHLFCVKQ